MFIKDEIIVFSRGAFHAENVTERIAAIAKKANVPNGLAVALLQHTTGCLVLLEHEAGIIADMKSLFEKIIPRAQEFYHHLRDVDDNGRAHLLSALFQSSLTIPIENGELALGEYQDVFFIDFQQHPKKRQVAVYIIGA